ncbi:hypothetical protein AB0F91_17560 [Amycolatopsis sp. NPDC023774]|uniref:hypothetical protein n=1 Tax=Amycolatopsis sp. NPDC023774 TaxID=3155015 RepID=UPI0033F18B66
MTTAYPVDGPLPTVSAQGNHHGLAGPPADAEHTRVRHEPVHAIASAGHQSSVGWPAGRATVEQSTFRMLAPHEIAAGMRFAKD